MTTARRVEKLEAQVASLQRRLAARTDQLILVLLQIEDVKAKAEAWDVLRGMVSRFDQSCPVTVALMNELVHPAPVNAPAET